MESVLPEPTALPLEFQLLLIVLKAFSVLKAAFSLLTAHAELIIQKRTSTTQETAPNVTLDSIVPSWVRKISI